MNRTFWRNGICLALLLVPALAGAETTVTIPVPDNVADEAKNLVLTITVPTELERVERPTRDVEIRKKKTRYRKYFDLNPFPPLVNPADPDIVKRFGLISAKDPALRRLLRNVSATNAYDLSRTIAHITRDMLEQTVEDLVARGVTRGAIHEYITVYDNYPKQLKIFNVGRREREEMVKLARKLSFTDGEIQVVKVETNDVGSTVIQLTVGGRGDRYKPEYVSRLEQGEPGELKMPATDTGEIKPADTLQFEENVGGNGGSGGGGAKPPEEFMDIFD